MLRTFSTKLATLLSCCSFSGLVFAAEPASNQKEATRLSSLLSSADSVNLVTTDTDIFSACTPGVRLRKECTLPVSTVLYSADSPIDPLFWGSGSAVEVLYDLVDVPAPLFLQVGSNKCALTANNGTASNLTTSCPLNLNGGPALSVLLTTPQGGKMVLLEKVTGTLHGLTLIIDKSLVIDKMQQLGATVTANLKEEIGTYNQMKLEVGLRAKDRDELDGVWKSLTTERNYSVQQNIVYLPTGPVINCPVFDKDGQPSHTADECSTLVAIWNIYGNKPSEFSQNDVDAYRDRLAAKAGVLTTLIAAFKARSTQIDSTWSDYVSKLKTSGVIP